ncbi:hypothetical protein B0A50_07277 [Salinomyces thailandicus]|uniref:GST N-terminal domain-containing protein n=1 Tax=Salinomyces thailandicus TaxID=706561 RepID=A0A4U0TN33_9PEZI|nr:hypothetical protein B0A50_07277 [Salinomyces thailandica]
MSADNSIIFYDIASGPPLRTFAANPWKTRFALNFKGVPYKTEWYNMPDITALRERLGVPANRTLPDGTPYHTLPVYQDNTKGILLGDSFEIALRLDEAYPGPPSLFRPSTIGLTAAFNAHVDGLFTKFASGLCVNMPLNPDALEASIAIFVKRAGLKSADEMGLSSEEHEKTLVSFEAALGELAKAYRHTGGTTDYFWRSGGTHKAQSQRPPTGREGAQPFLDGDSPAYSDFIVGAWLKMFEESTKPEDWQRIKSWQGGLWGKVVEALGPWTEIK